MIVINMRMPDSCMACPFVAPGQRGLKCSVMEYIGTRTLNGCAVKPTAGGRASWCPLCEISHDRGEEHDGETAG